MNSKYIPQQNPGQSGFWADRTILAADKNGLPLVQVIADSLQITRPSLGRAAGDVAAAFEYVNQMQLPPYFIPLPAHIEATVREAFDQEVPSPEPPGVPKSLVTIPVLTDSELNELSADLCSPFRLSSRNVIEHDTMADGRRYWVSIEIQLIHVGEALTDNSAVAIIAPRTTVRIRPHPDEDSAPVIWQTLIGWLGQAIEDRSGRLKPPFVEDAFSGGEGRMPNNHFIAAGILALNKTGKDARTLTNGWRPNTSGRLTFTYEPRKTKQISVYTDDYVEGAIADMEKVWQRIEELPPETQDVAIAVLAQMCEPSLGDKPRYPMLMPVAISDDAILKYMCVKGTTRERARLVIHRSMEYLQSMMFDVNFESCIPGHRLSWQGDRLFHIVKVQHLQDGIFGETTTKSTMWAVRAGLWASVWLNRDTRQYIGSIAQVLVEFGSQGKGLLAKRLGQRLLPLSQVCHPRGVVEIFVHRLLDEVGELPCPDHRPKNWAARTREAFEEALEMLKGRVLKAVEWPDGFGPADIDRSKGWSDRWLNSRVRVTTTANMRSQPGVGNKPVRDYRKRGDRINMGAISGSAIRSARKNILPEVSQQELADIVGISRRHLSRIETEKMKPSSVHRARFRDWIDERKKQEEQG